MKRRLISMILALAIIVSALFCFNISIVYGANSGNCGASTLGRPAASNATFKYDTASKTLTISGTGATKDYGDTVVNRTPWYSYRTDITKVVIEEGIETIGKLNFYGCTALTEVSLPSTLKTISGSSSISLGEDSVSAVSYGAFRECTALKKINLPSGLETIEPRAFQGCTALTSITFPDSLTTLGDGAFMDCTNLITVTYGTGLTSTGTRAFYNAGVKTVKFSPTIKRIDGWSFYGCKMTSIEIPHEIETIGTRAFATCSFLNKVTVNNPNTVFEGVINKEPFDGSSQKITFYGHRGSTTEVYVTDHPNANYEFVSIDPCDHTSTHDVVTLEPTCTEKGKLTQVCDECGVNVRVTDINALGHKWEISEEYDETAENGHVIRISVCANENCPQKTKQEIEHKEYVEGFYTYERTGSCKVGTEKYTCTFEGCGKSKTVPFANKHIVDEFTVTKEPTCTEKGTKEGVCCVCNETVTQEIPALGHTNILAEELDNTANDGHIYEIYNCSVCGVDTTVPKHIEWMDNCYESNVLSVSNCSIPGTRVDTCTICSERRTVTLETKPHELTETSRTEPTCTSDGYIFYQCNNCNHESREKIPKLGHDNVLIESVEPTCTAEGKNVWHCQRCGNNSEEKIDKKPHVFLEYTPVEGATATCTTDGKQKAVCTQCNIEYELTIAALGHNYEDVLVPVANKPGHSLATPTCTRCGDKSTQRTVHDEWIEGHYKTTLVTKGNCTTPAESYDTCNDCGERRNHYTPAPGHKYDYTGLDSNGRLTYKCSVCGGNAVPLGPASVLALWNVRYANTAPGDTDLGYRFELVNDGIINAKDYSYLVRLNPKQAPDEPTTEENNQ